MIRQIHRGNHGLFKVDWRQQLVQQRNCRRHIRRTLIKLHLQGFRRTIHDCWERIEP